MKDNKSICAVISLFNPNITALSSLISSISSCVDKIVLVDNSEQSVDYHPLMSEEFFIIKQDNSGITGAMNSGLEYTNYTYDYYLFLDQDSFFSADNLNSYIHTAIEKNHDISAPNIIDYDDKEIHSKYLSRHSQVSSDFVKVNIFQLSGMLVTSKVLSVVGCFNEDYFLNLGDVEWCLRASRLGYCIQVNKNVSMNHSFADGVTAIGPYKFFYGAPFRLYYKSRDSLRLIFGPSPILVKLKLITRLFATFLEISVLDEKKERFKFFLKGFYGYFTGCKGRMRD